VPVGLRGDVVGDGLAAGGAGDGDDDPAPAPHPVVLWLASPVRQLLAKGAVPMRLSRVAGTVPVKYCSGGGGTGCGAHVGS
jgi:hypothetical protein